MAEALKDFFSPDLVRRLAGEIQAAHPAFPAAAFVAEAAAGLDDLALVARAEHIGRTLGRHLPPTYPEAIAVILASLGPPHATDELEGVGISPFFYMPHLAYVAERGLEDFELSMRAQYELTRRFSAEFSIRTFLVAEPERTMAVLERWTADPDAHVRRLPSEGTRLRLPWGKRVAWLDRHPERVLALLDRLKDDPSTMVRRSVANNLNDLGKVHPDLLVATCRAWLADAGPERRKLVEHALRSAVKRGHPEVLALLGYGGAPEVAVEDVRFEPATVAIGGKVALAFVLRNPTDRPQDVLVDYAVHFVKARGTAPKVFKLRRVTLPPGGAEAFRASVSVAEHTTRTPRPGTHAVEVRVNGQAVPLGAFEVVTSRP